MDKTDDLSISSDAFGTRLFMLGNEAIARGAIEGGVQVVAAYPGTPATEIAETLIAAAKKLGIYAEWSVNEKVAFGVALGASLCGVRAMAVMKHVGVNVALDSLLTATYIGAKGGLVLVEAEDPGQWSSQNEQDNRYLAELAYIPVLEPSSAQEAKDMTAAAFRLSEQFHQPFMLRSVTRIGHSRSDITLGEIYKVKPQGVFKKDPDLVLLPAVARKHRKLMVARLARIGREVDFWSYNRLTAVKEAKIGIIASGISYSYVREALSWLGLQDSVSLLKIGTPYPLPVKLIGDLLRSVPLALVVEELEPFVENHVRAIAQRSGIRIAIHGKDILPLVGELATRHVTGAIAQLTGVRPPVDFNRIDRLVQEVAPLLPVRPPSMCAGCPHRASHLAINIACERVKRETGVEPVRPGDIGCYCMGANAPLEAVDTSTCMGGGFDIANGMSRVLDAPVVAHLGDSTFFHSGIAPLINAVFNKTRMVMVVLDNLTTAMTGSQANPGVGYNASQEAPQIRPEALARAIGVKFVRVVDPLDITNCVAVMEQAIKFNGPSMVVFRRACSILEQREKRARGEEIIPYRIEQSKCVAGSPPPCTAACPLHIDARGYVGLVGEGKYDEALRLIKQKLPFPGILGRICTRPCESECKRREVDESIAIAALKRSAADYGKMEDEDLIVADEKAARVSIVGGGPSGLMAAYDLRKLGYRVTIFEALPKLGGMLAVGIPEYRLPAAVTRQEIDRIRKLGIEVRLNTRVGTDIRLSELREQYNAVFIATGAHAGISLDIAGSTLEGAINGIDFLRDVNLAKKNEVKGRVVVIGGGNVAVDCARLCLRLGCQDVNIMYRRSRQEMPAITGEVKEAEREGVRFHFRATPVRILGSERVSGLECIRMRPGQPDASGRRSPVPIKGSEFRMEADMIISAIGEQPDLRFTSDDNISLSVKDGLLQADPVTLETNIGSIFAGGDAVTGPATVIDALAAGRKAAISIDRYLKGEPLAIDREGEGSQTSLLIVDTTGIGRKRRLNVPTLDVSSRFDNMGEVELGYTPEKTDKEASRCLVCGCEVCIQRLGCPAIITDYGEINIDSTQCPGCGICAQICPAGAIVPGKV